MNAWLHISGVSQLEAWSGWWSASLWRACWQGSVFILLVWGLCRVMPHLPPRIRHRLWLLACLKLVVGLFWAAPLVVPARSGALRPPVMAAHPSPRSVLSLVGTGRDSGANSVPALLPSTMRPLLSGRACLFGLWLIGVMCGVVQGMRQLVRLGRMCKGAQSLDATEIGEWAREMGVRLGLSRPPRVAECDTIAAPLVTGPIHPLVLLPPGFAARFSPEEARLALAHELAHLRGRDLWLALIPACAQILFFFLPPAWFACREWTTALEAARDNEALLLTGMPPVLYGQLLLKLVTQDATHWTSEWRGALGTTAHYHTLKQRLTWIALQKHPPCPTSRLKRLAALPAVLPVLLLVAPWQVQAGSMPAAVPASAPPSVSSARTDLAQTPAQDLRANGDPRKRYLLIGANAQNPPPADGYHLLVVLPGGAGGADFQYFVKRIQAWGLPPGYLIAELIAPQWTKYQAQTLVWPTRANTLPGVGFPTEAFVEDVIRDVKQRCRVDARRVFTLGWASGGPACYATALQTTTQTRGAFIAMSVFTPSALPSLEHAHDRRFWLQQPIDAPMAPLDMAACARTRLRQAGGTVELVTVEGGYGWHGHVYSQIRRGIDWLEQQ